MWQDTRWRLFPSKRITWYHQSSTPNALACKGTPCSCGKPSCTVLSSIVPHCLIFYLGSHCPKDTEGLQFGRYCIGIRRVRCVVAFDVLSSSVLPHFSWTRKTFSTMCGNLSEFSPPEFDECMISSHDRQQRITDYSYTYRSIRRPPRRYRCTPATDATDHDGFPCTRKISS